MIYTPRLTKPEKNNKYYNTKSNGGYSNAIKGKCKSTGAPDKDCDVLSNCVGYVHGRFHEILKDPKMSYLCPVNAENFPEYVKNCKTGSTPKLGSIIVWQKGTSLKDCDGAGHVAVVEQIISDTQIVISQSGYNSSTFWTETITKKNNNWLCSWMNSNYKFRCFIYNPAVDDDTKPLLTKGDKGKFVKELQNSLNKLINSNLTVDGIFGPNCEKAVKEFQKKYKLTSDGAIGAATWNKISELLDKPEGVSDLNFILNGKQVEAWGLLINEQGYVRLNDLVNLGLFKSVTYNSLKKLWEVITK